MTEENYQKAYAVIFSGSLLLTSFPKSVIDWIIALNLVTNKTVIPNNKSSSILFANDKDLIILAQKLNLHEVNKERILRILKYLGKLENDMSVYDMFPEEIILNVLRNLDCKDIFLTCNYSQRFSNLCGSNNFLQLMRRKITESTGFLTNEYGLEQLKNICRIDPRRKHYLITRGARVAILDLNGQLHVYGENTEGQLGLGHNNDIQGNMVTVSGINNIVQASYGHNHSLILDSFGHVYATGESNYGKLGLGKLDESNIATLGLENNLGPIIDDEQSINAYTLIPGSNNIISVSTSGNHSLLLTSEGKVYSFGLGSSGQLGLGDYEDRYIPELIPELHNIVQISAGLLHSLALTANGNVYSFGINNRGQLGAPINRRANPVLISGLNNIIQVSAGAYHSLVLTSDGQVLSFGSNRYGQLGLGDNKNRHNPELIFGLNNIVQISSGWNYSLALTNNGKIYAFGNNSHYQLGLDDNINRNSPELIPFAQNVIQMEAGDFSSLILTANRKVYTIGVDKDSFFHIFTI